MEQKFNIDALVVQYNYNNGTSKTENVDFSAHGIKGSQLLDYIHGRIPNAPADPRKWIAEGDCIYCVTHDVQRKYYSMNYFVYITKEATEDDFKAIGINPYGTPVMRESKLHEAKELRYSDKEFEEIKSNADGAYIQFLCKLMLGTYERPENKKLLAEVTEEVNDFICDSKLKAEAEADFEIDTTSPDAWEPSSVAVTEKLPTRILELKDLRDFMNYVGEDFFEECTNMEDSEWEYYEEEFGLWVIAYAEEVGKVKWGEPDYDAYWSYDYGPNPDDEYERMRDEGY